MDSIPHWDFGTNWRNRPKHITGLISITDTVLGIALSFFIFRPYVNPLVLLAGIVFAILPDWLETPWYIVYAHHDKTKPGDQAGLFEKLAYRIYKTENYFHNKSQYPLGLLTQVVTVALFLLLLK